MGRAVGDERLSSTATEILEDATVAIYASAISGFELSTKYRLGKLPEAAPLVFDFEGWLRRLGFLTLQLTIRHAVHAGSYPATHRDPFDRLLAAQAELEGMILLSRDSSLDEFGIRRKW